MGKTNQIRQFVDRNVERQLVREYLRNETERAGFGGLHFERAFDSGSICTKVTVQAERVGMVIGRQGKIINELQNRIATDFNLENPKLQAEEIENPALNAQVMASKLASALERGWYFRRAGHSTVLNVMEAGAKGCLVIIAGKLTGSRHRTEKFTKGHIKYCGETAIEHMDIGQATAVVKLGTIGCTVALMKPGTKLPHEVEITSRVDSGLGPYVPPSIIEAPVEEQSLTEEEAEDELSALEQLEAELRATEEAAAEQADADAEAEGESDTEPEAEAQGESDTEAESGTDTEAAEMAADTPESEAQGESDTEAESGTDTEAAEMAADTPESDEGGDE